MRQVEDLPIQMTYMFKVGHLTFKDPSWFLTQLNVILNSSFIIYLLLRQVDLLPYSNRYIVLHPRHLTSSTMI